MPGDTQSSANAEAIEAWDTVLFDKFSRFRDIIVNGFATHGLAAMDRHPPAQGARVLDLGCGFGDTTLVLGQRVGPAGEAVGVDAAKRFIEDASRTAKAKGAKNVRYAVADVEGDSLGGPYDMAFSRFGMMFFASPVRAFRNVRSAMKKGAPLSIVVWRKKDENAWLARVEERVLQIVPHPEKKEQITCGPGPFSMSSPDVVSAQLLAAGFSRPTFERLDVDVRIGRDVDDALAFALALGPAGEVIRLAGEAATRKMPEITASIREVLGEFARPEGVIAPSSSWLISAVA